MKSSKKIWFGATLFLLSDILLRILGNKQLCWHGIKLDVMAKCFNLLLEYKLFVEHISTKIIVAIHGWQFIIFCLKVMQVRDFMVRTFEAMSEDDESFT